jgi:hypothetical protein
MRGSGESLLTCLTLRTVSPEIREGVFIGEGRFREHPFAVLKCEGEVWRSGSGWVRSTSGKRSW